MFGSVSMKTAVGSLAVFGMLATAGNAFAQEAGETRPRATAPKLVFKVDWVRPASQENTKVRYMPVQENVADPNVEMKFYGAAKQILTTGAPGATSRPTACGRVRPRAVRSPSRSG